MEPWGTTTLNTFYLKPHKLPITNEWQNKSKNLKPGLKFYHFLRLSKSLFFYKFFKELTKYIKKTNKAVVFSHRPLPNT